MSTFRGSGIAPDGLPYAMHDIPASAYPFTMEAFGPDGELIWSFYVEGPGAIKIPGTGPGSVKLVRLTFADGEVVESTQ